MFEETCSDVVDVDVDSMEESSLKTIFQQLEPVCESMVELWEEVDDEVDEVNNFIYKRSSFLLLMLMIIIKLIMSMMMTMVTMIMIKKTTSMIYHYY